ncbi:dihydrofolate reductase [Hoeflea marina]|uniref:Dihydrofolate reductase n=1 Tax=Hoeflea marina TaxID=274592 RepID=A0A317PGU0_9HYPH|nr:dihydrofolate reductase [Hoeflea marina]PWV99156.1 dihydrofolate reductase [Hoeflea marina]
MAEGAIDVVLVVAMADNRIIGADGGMPWRLPTDLKRFKAVTLGKPVIMGRKTWESIGRPLPGRANIVVSRSASALEGAEVAASLNDALVLARAHAAAAGAGQICIIGGGEIYRQAMDLADELVVTHVSAELDGDTEFPEIDPEIWRRISEIPIHPGERDSHAMVFANYRRHR